MNRIASSISALLLLTVWVEAADAQWNVARTGTNPNRVYTTFGMDPAWVASIGYARVVQPFGHDFQLLGDVGVATAHMDLDDFRARLGTQTSVVRWRSLHLTGSALFITRGTHNVIYRGLNFGADVTTTLGVHRQRWFAAGEFGKDKAIVTHVTHTAWYRTYYYADAKDGWYLDAGGTYHYGLVAGFALRGTEIVGRFGWLKTEEFNDVSPPLYASLGVGYAF